jgi:glycosyltransferase involved in cell wall biosynthesis
LKKVEEPDETVAKLKQEGIRRILTDHAWRFLVRGSSNERSLRLRWFVEGTLRRIARYCKIEREIGWTKYAEMACDNLTARDVDVILASGSPFSAFGLANKLSSRINRPYVLDYRDPWTGNPHAVGPDWPFTIRKEERLLKGSAAVTIVSPAWALALNDRFNLGPKLHVVTNGFDPEELVEVARHDFGHFAIVYAGQFYPPKRVIGPVMAALRRLKECVESKEWYFHYYGDQENHILEEANNFAVTERVIIHGRVPRAELLSALRGAGIAVVITSVREEATIEDRGIVTGKVFEPLGLGTPILMIAPAGSDVETISETTGLVQCFEGSNIEGIASFLSDLMFKRRTLNAKKLGGYAWPNLVKKLDSVLRTVAQG